MKEDTKNKPIKGVMDQLLERLPQYKGNAENLKRDITTLETTGQFDFSSLTGVNAPGQEQVLDALASALEVTHSTHVVRNIDPAKRINPATEFLAGNSTSQAKKKKKPEHKNRGPSL